MVERGCAASGSIAQANRAALWLGDDLRVYIMQGLQPQPISTPDIERKIQAQTTTSARAFTYEQQGQLFYVLSFPHLTVVYSLTTGLWHVRKSAGIERWRGGAHAYWLNRNVVGDYSDGRIYELDLETFTDDGETIARSCIAPPIYAGGQPVFQGDLLLGIEGGNGLISGQGSDPRVMLDWSDTNGKTWSSEVTASAGPQGAYTQQAVWNRLGRFPHTRHIRLSISDPVRVHWTGAFATLEAGT